MTRLSRAESQLRTRERLVATARQLFLRDGYHATTLEKVADAAGFSKGAVYSNFATKDDLCLAVIEAIRSEHIQAVQAAFQNEGSADDRLALFETWAQRTIGDPGWTLLEAEFAIHATRRDPALRAQVATGAKTWVETLRHLLEREASQRSIELPLSSDQLAEALLSLGIGLALRRAVDPAVSPIALTDLLRLILNPTQPPHSPPPGWLNPSDPPTPPDEPDPTNSPHPL